MITPEKREPRRETSPLRDGFHCDPDFQTVKPPDIVRTLVQTLSKRGGKIQPCTPFYTALRPNKSQPIKISDPVSGCIRTNLRLKGRPPFSLRRLYFNEKHLSAADKKGATHQGILLGER
ncbi:hypothetical protein KEJ21_01580 [Candidatus Bathyarchaeota archaeon]|nr:hypothetical protein [Candidatus Bathyarchaeota archaeon]MBS7630875.1 hypothetical protein [Candidatus Bathyarchaeota archaeon]